MDWIQRPRPPSEGLGVHSTHNWELEPDPPTPNPQGGWVGYTTLGGEGGHSDPTHIYAMSPGFCMECARKPAGNAKNLQYAIEDTHGVYTKRYFLKVHQKVDLGPRLYVIGCFWSSFQMCWCAAASTRNAIFQILSRRWIWRQSLKKKLHRRPIRGCPKRLRTRTASRRNASF